MKQDADLRAGLSALVKGWLSVESSTRNPTRLSSKTGINPKRLKRLIDGKSEPTLSETMSILEAILPDAPHEHKRFLLRHCKYLPWAADEPSEEEEKETFRSMDFENQQKFLRQKLATAFDSLQKIVEDYEKHAGYLVEELVEKFLAVEMISDQIAVRYEELSKRYKTVPERWARSAFRSERSKRRTLEQENAELRNVIRSLSPVQ